jgi:hypothetical protein
MAKPPKELIKMAILQSVLQGQGVGQQIGGVSAATTQYVQQQVALQAEQRQQQQGGGGGYVPPFSGVETKNQDWESMAWLLLGLI